MKTVVLNSSVVKEMIKTYCKRMRLDEEDDNVSKRTRGVSINIHRL